MADEFKNLNDDSDVKERSIANDYEVSPIKSNRASSNVKQIESTVQGDISREMEEAVEKVKLKVNFIYGH